MIINHPPLFNRSFNRSTFPFLRNLIVNLHWVYEEELKWEWLGGSVSAASSWLHLLWRQNLDKHVTPELLHCLETVEMIMKRMREKLASKLTRVLVVQLLETETWPEMSRMKRTCERLTRDWLSHSAFAEITSYLTPSPPTNFMSTYVRILIPPLTPRLLK